MYNSKQIKRIFQKIQVVRAPKHRLATFGTSKIHYHLITDVPGLPDRSRLRLGLVTAEKPTLITPQTLKEQFLGFSQEAGAYADSLLTHYGEALRGLEYQFKNEPLETRIELTPPDAFVARIAKGFDHQETFDSALIRGPEKVWELALMKFIVEETMASFSTNLQELKDRGFLDPDRDERRRHREIQHLFTQARSDRRAIPTLGAKLKEYGMFEQYQDSFFKLIQS